MGVSEIISVRIYDLCHQRNLAIHKLAAMSGVPYSSLASVLNGQSQNPSILLLMRIANTFNMTISEFLNIEGLNNYFKDDLPGEE